MDNITDEKKEQKNINIENSTKVHFKKVEKKYKIKQQPVDGTRKSFQERIELRGSNLRKSVGMSRTEYFLSFIFILVVIIIVRIVKSSLGISWMDLYKESF